MSKITKKLYLIKENDPERRTAEIRIYPDGVHLVVRDEYQYPIFGIISISQMNTKDSIPLIPMMI